jgi:tetratricopeptide (TPR) repeat protein
MFGDMDNFYEEDETLGLMKRYREMLLHNLNEFFDLYEFESIINYFTDEYNYKEALKVVSLAIRQHPHASLMRLKHAQLLIEISRPARAIRILKTMGDEESSNYELHLAKGIAYIMTGKLEEARISFNKALDLCDELKDELAYNIAQSYMQYNMYNLAADYLLLAYHYNRNNILVLYDLGLSYDKLHDPEKSLLFYQKYLNMDPFAEHVWNNMGVILSRLGDYEHALEAFEFAISINVQFLPAFFSKADMFVISGRVKEAIDVYNELIREDNSNTRALCNLASCYVSTGDFYEALRLYKISLDISNDCAEALFGSGIVYFRQKRYTQSITAIKRAIAVEPAISEYWLTLGDLYNRTRKLNKAIDAYSRASELNPDDLDSKFACAQVFFRKRRIHEAIYMMMRIFEKHPDNVLVNYRLAAYYAYQQNLFEAQRFFKRALFLNFSEHIEMFRHFPKTKNIQAFRTIIENHGHLSNPAIKISK